MKKCSKCKVEKPFIEFNKDKKLPYGLRCQCKECIKEYASKNIDKKREYDRQHHQKYYQIHGDALRQQKKTYNQSPQGKLSKITSVHKRRALLIANTPIGKHFTTADIILKLKLQKGKCIYCQISIKEYYEIDHIIPAIQGGSNMASNIQLLCEKCNGNSGKGTKLPYEFAQQHGKLI